MPIKTNTFFSTDREIQNLKAQAKRFTVKDKLNNGLFIEVKESGIKSWHYRYTLNGKQERLVIGRYPDLSLKEARQIRDESASMVAKGISPKKEKDDKKLGNSNSILFKDYGLLFVDGDDKELKKLMISTFEKELIQQKSYQHVIPQNAKLEALGYSIQVNPREINLFYMKDDNSRERIVEENGTYFVNNTSIKFTKEEIIADLHQNPDKFSPNVILRPLYQETILPNVAYIGGGGEIAYWLQLKEMFIQFEIDFPLLVLRNSMLIRTEKQYEKQQKLNLTNEDLFSNSLIITKKRVMNLSEIAPIKG